MRLKRPDWFVILGLLVLFALGALWSHDSKANVLDPGTVIPVKAVCDSAATLKHILMLEGDAQAAAVQHSVDTEACIVLPVPMPMKVRMLADEFHTKDALIYVYEMDLPETEGNWYAFTYEAATGT